MTTETAICRDCGNYVPVENAVRGPDEAGTVVCRECGGMDSWRDF